MVTLFLIFAGIFVICYGSFGSNAGLVTDLSINIWNSLPDDNLQLPDLAGTTPYSINLFDLFLIRLRFIDQRKSQSSSAVKQIPDVFFSADTGNDLTCHF